MGMTPLTFSEIKSFAEATSVKLSSFDVLTLKELSVAYVGQTNDKDQDAIAPNAKKITLSYLDEMLKVAK